MKIRTIGALVVAGLLASAGSSFAAPIPIDLNTWTERGNAANGVWTVQDAGASVFQSINGNPTFFVSPTNLINKVFTGKITVQTTSDDDYIGFVFGFSAPTGNAASGENAHNFVLFDWKQGNQSSGGFLALEGFALSRVNGTITNYVPGFWGHTDSAEFDVLATNQSTTLGWQDNVEYTFTILYQENHFKLDLAGGAFGAGQTIFDVDGTFPDGRFGFYNYSQASVRYSGLTEEEAPPNDDGPPPSGIPSPATLVLVSIGLVGAQLLRRR